MNNSKKEEVLFRSMVYANIPSNNDALLEEFLQELTLREQSTIEVEEKGFLKEVIGEITSNSREEREKLQLKVDKFIQGMNREVELASLITSDLDEIKKVTVELKQSIKQLNSLKELSRSRELFLAFENELFNNTLEKEHSLFWRAYTLDLKYQEIITIATKVYSLSHKWQRYISTQEGGSSF